jgi:hypothetical protein
MSDAAPPSPALTAPAAGGAPPPLARIVTGPSRQRSAGHVLTRVGVLADDEAARFVEELLSPSGGTLRPARQPSSGEGAACQLHAALRAQLGPCWRSTETVGPTDRLERLVVCALLHQLDLLPEALAAAATVAAGGTPSHEPLLRIWRAARKVRKWVGEQVQRRCAVRDGDELHARSDAAALEQAVP